MFVCLSVCCLSCSRALAAHTHTRATKRIFPVASIHSSTHRWSHFIHFSLSHTTGCVLIAWPTSTHTHTSTRPTTVECFAWNIYFCQSSVRNSKCLIVISFTSSHIRHQHAFVWTALVCFCPMRQTPFLFLSAASLFFDFLQNWDMNNYILTFDFPIRVSNHCRLFMRPDRFLVDLFIMRQKVLKQNLVLAFDTCSSSQQSLTWKRIEK